MSSSIHSRKGAAAAALIPLGSLAKSPPIPITRPVTVVGSRQDVVRLHLQSSTVSKAHCVIVLNAWGCYIHDLGSRTHTWVNKKQVADANLVDGDEVQIGRFRFKYVAPRAASGKPVPAAPAEVDVNTLTDPLPLSKRVIQIGRRVGSDLQFDDPAVSNIHAIIFEHDGGRFVRDLTSRTGTWVDGQPIHQHALGDGMLLKIGRSVLTYRHLAAPERAPAASEARLTTKAKPAVEKTPLLPPDISEGAREAPAARQPVTPTPAELDPLIGPLTNQGDYDLKDVDLKDAGLENADVKDREFEDIVLKEIDLAASVGDSADVDLADVGLGAADSHEPVSEVPTPETLSPAEVAEDADVAKADGGRVDLTASNEAESAALEADSASPQIDLAEFDLVDIDLAELDANKPTPDIDDDAEAADTADQPGVDLSAFNFDDAESASDESAEIGVAGDDPAMRVEIDSPDLALRAPGDNATAPSDAALADEPLELLPLADAPNVVKPTDEAPSTPSADPVVDSAATAGPGITSAADDSSKESLDEIDFGEIDLAGLDLPADDSDDSLSSDVEAESDAEVAIGRLDLPEAEVPSAEAVDAVESVEPVEPVEVVEAIEADKEEESDRENTPVVGDAVETGAADDEAGEVDELSLDDEIADALANEVPADVDEAAEIEEKAVAEEVAEQTAKDADSAAGPVEIVSVDNRSSDDVSPAEVLSDAERDVSSAGDELVVADEADVPSAESPDAEATDAKSEPTVAEDDRLQERSPQLDSPRRGWRGAAATIDDAEDSSDAQEVSQPAAVEEIGSAVVAEATEVTAKTETDKTPDTSEASPASTPNPVPESSSPRNDVLASAAGAVELDIGDFDLDLSATSLGDPPADLDEAIDELLAAATVTDTAPDLSDDVATKEAEPSSGVLIDPAGSAVDDSAIGTSETAEDVLSDSDINFELDPAPLDGIVTADTPAAEDHRPPDKLPDTIVADPASAEVPLSLDDVDEDEDVIDSVDDLIDLVRFTAPQSSEVDQTGSEDLSDTSADVSAIARASSSRDALLGEENEPAGLTLDDLDDEHGAFTAGRPADRQDVDPVSRLLTPDDTAYDVSHDRSAESSNDFQGDRHGELHGEVVAGSPFSTDDDIELLDPPTVLPGGFGSTRRQAADEFDLIADEVGPDDSVSGSIVEPARADHDSTCDASTVVENDNDIIEQDLADTDEPHDGSLSDLIPQDGPMLGGAFGPHFAAASLGGSPIISFNDGHQSRTAGHAGDPSTPDNSSADVDSDAGADANNRFNDSDGDGSPGTTAERQDDPDRPHRRRPLKVGPTRASFDSSTSTSGTPPQAPSSSPFSGAGGRGRTIGDVLIGRHGAVSTDVFAHPSPTAEELLLESTAADGEVDQPPSGDGHSDNGHDADSHGQNGREAAGNGRARAGARNNRAGGSADASGNPDDRFDDDIDWADRDTVRAEREELLETADRFRPRGGISVAEHTPHIPSIYEPVEDPAVVADTKRRRLRRMLVCALMIVPLAGLAAWSVYHYVPVYTNVSAMITFAGLDRLSIEERREQRLMQRGFIFQEPTRLDAVNSLKDSVMPGFLSDTGRLSEAIVQDRLWDDDRLTELRLVVRSTDKAADRERLRVLATAVISANNVQIRKFTKLTSDNEDGLREIANKTSEREKLESEIARLTTLEAVKPDEQALDEMDTRVTQAETDLKKVKAARQEAEATIERLKQQPTTRPDSLTNVDVASADAELAKLGAQAAEISKQAEAAKVATAAQNAEARAALDKVIGQFQEEIETAQKRKAGPELAAYVEAANGIFKQTRQLTDDLMRRQEQQRTRQNELKDKLATKQEARTKEMLAKDDELKRLNDRVAILTRQYNSLHANGHDSESTDVKEEMRQAKILIDARKELFKNDSVYTDTSALLQQLIDQTEKDIRENRVHIDETLTKAQQDFLKNAPAVERLPEAQKELAESIQKRMDAVGQARKAYAAAAARGEAEQTKTEEQSKEKLIALNLEISARKQDLRAVARQEQAEAIEEDRKKKLVEQETAIATLQGQEKKAQELYDQAIASRERMRQQSNESMNSKIALLDAEQRKGVLQAQIKKINHAIDQNRIDLGKLVIPSETPELSSDEEPDRRPLYAAVSAGSMILLMLIPIVWNLLLVSRDSHRVFDEDPTDEAAGFDALTPADPSEPEELVEFADDDPVEEPVASR